MVLLRKMTEPEFDEFLAQNIPAYAAEKVRAGSWAPEEALERARAETMVLLPAGIATPNHHLYTIESQGSAAGRIWLSTERTAVNGSAFIYDLYIAEAYRRQGAARQAMLLIEGEAARLGAKSLGLHVFGGNTAALALYEQLGYEVTDINMAKKISNQ